MHSFRRFIVYGLITFAVTGCNLMTSSIMLRTPADYKFSQLPDTVSLQYKITKSDLLQFRLFANDGFRLVDVTGEASNQQISQTNRAGILYLVEYDGTVKFPILGRVHLEGMTVREAELMLQQKYSEYFNNPFLILRVENRRVLLFPGGDGDAKVINLENDNTTLLEALASAGGIADVGKSYRIKLIRGSITNPSNPQVYLIDLSTIEGIKQGRTVLQANDIIYIEPRYKIASRVLIEIAPYLSLLTTAILIYTLTQNFSKAP